MPENRQLLSHTIKIADKKVTLGQRCAVISTLQNIGETTIVVNKRMAVGYREHISRELFADLVDIESGQQAPFFEVDYDREFSPPSDYITLGKDEVISTAFDLFEWYLPRQPGFYRLTLYYQADEELASCPADVIRGIHESNTVNFEVHS